MDSSRNSFGIMSEPGRVRIARLLPGPIERIWDYLTVSDKRAQWLAGGDMEPLVGGPVELVFRNSELTGHSDAPPPKYAALAGSVSLHGHVTACEPPRLLSYTWNEGSAGPSQVQFALTQQGSDVLLVVTHWKITNERERVSTGAGWHTHLDILVDRLHGRGPDSFWPTHTRLEAEYTKLADKR